MTVAFLGEPPRFLGVPQRSKAVNGGNPLPPPIQFPEYPSWLMGFFIKETHVKMLFALVFLVLSTPLKAQIPRQSLSSPDARLSAEFSELIAIRELSDGRVLLYDRKEARLVVVDFGTGTMRDVARKGQGPAEFEYVAALLPLPSDTTIAADMDRRWLILKGDSVLRKLLPEHPALQRLALAPLGADRAFVLSQSFDRRSDSTGVVLVNRTSGATDTVAHLANDGRRGPVLGTTTVPGMGTAARIGRLPLRWGEWPRLFSDGWIAVVRVDPYRVDWRSPDGRWTLGKPLPFRAVRITAEEKAAYLTRHQAMRNATNWPDVLPPFEMPVTVLASPEGFLVVKRLPTLAEPGTRYDVIDRTSARRAQLVLPANQHILGFGAASVYVVATDDDGIQRLQRHPWSTSPRP